MAKPPRAGNMIRLLHETYLIIKELKEKCEKTRREKHKGYVDLTDRIYMYEIIHAIFRHIDLEEVTEELNNWIDEDRKERTKHV